MTANRRQAAKKKPITPSDLYQVEQALDSALEMVAPRKDFVQGLRTRLEFPVGKAANPIGLLEYFLLFLAGIASATLLIVASVRTVLVLVESIRHLRGTNTNRKSPPPSLSLSQ